MKTLNTTKLFEATIASAVIVGAAALVIPAIGLLATAGMVGAGLFAMVVLDSRKRAY